MMLVDSTFALYLESERARERDRLNPSASDATSSATTVEVAAAAARTSVGGKRLPTNHICCCLRCLKTTELSKVLAMCIRNDGKSVIVRSMKRVGRL